MVLRLQQLAAQQRPGLVRRGVERRVRDERPQHEAHDAVIPACVISSTSYASLRIRWSRYCSEVTADVNGATKAVDEHRAERLDDDEHQQRYAGVGHREAGDLADDGERDR